MASLMINRQHRTVEVEDAQGSLFGGEAFGAAAVAEPAGRDVASASGSVAPAGVAVAPANEGSLTTAPPTARVATTPIAVPPHEEAVAGEELAELERAAVVTEDVRAPRALVARPTLDDVVSRVWEGLATGLPAACPVCEGEVIPAVQPARHGQCRSCGTVIE
jgi:hypothetical protein